MVSAARARMTARGAVLVLDLLERAGIPTWVAGGWGVDALVGQESRAHGDLDLLIPRATGELARGRLDDAGFAVTLEALPTRFEMTHPALGVVDLHPIHGADATDDTHHDPPWLELPDGARWEYGPGALDAVGTIGSRRCRCLSAQEQLRLHQGYELREIDREDIRLLRSLLDRGPTHPD